MEKYIQITEKFTSVPGGGHYVQKSVDFTPVQVVFKDEGAAYDFLMGEVALKALPGHYSIMPNGLRMWGWYEVDDQAEVVSWWVD